jgi:hypothetical protein
VIVSEEEYCIWLYQKVEYVIWFVISLSRLLYPRYYYIIIIIIINKLDLVIV